MILYYDKYSCSNVIDQMMTLATAKFGYEPIKMKIGIDVTIEEVEDLLVVDLQKTGLPVLTSTDDDQVIDIYEDDSSEDSRPRSSWDDFTIPEYWR